MCCANKMKRIAENMNRIRMFSYRVFCCCCSVFCFCFVRCCHCFEKSKSNNNAHATWLDVRLEMYPFHSLVFAALSTHIGANAYIAEIEMKYMHKYAIGKTNENDEHRTNERRRKKKTSSRWAPKYLVPMPHVYAFLLFTTSNAYKCTYI